MLKQFGKLWQSSSSLAASAFSSINGYYHSFASTTYGQKMVNFITAPVEKKSVREGHYIQSNFISEYYCTLSNIGILGVGLYYSDYSAIAAATFSALSHAIPSQRLHDLDLLGIALVGINVATNYDVILKRPDVLIWGAGALALNLLDTFIARNLSSKQFDKIEPWLHVTWHFAAGLALYKFNSAKMDLSAHSSTLNTIDTSDICKNYLPGYGTLKKLVSSCNEYIPQASKVMRKL